MWCLKMRLLILFVLALVYQINGLCYVSNDVCKKGWSALFAKDGDCGISCTGKTTSDCSSSSISKKKFDTVGRVILKAVPHFETHAVHFELTVLDTTWKKFKIRMYDDSYPKVSVCRSYKSKGILPSPTTVEVKINGQPYANYQKKRIDLKYELQTRDADWYGKLSFLAPSFVRFTTGQVNEMEMFNYVDNTNKTFLKLNIQIPKPPLEVRNFDVEVWRDMKTKMDSQSLMAMGDRLIFSHNVTESTGEYNFVFTPKSPLCGPYGCMRTTSVTIDMGSPGWVLWAIIGAVVIILVIIGVVVCCFCRG